MAMNMNSVTNEHIDRPTLQWNERLHYRDRLRSARYAALADAEGFSEICFAIEALGLRLLGQKAEMGSYMDKVSDLARDSLVLSDLWRSFPGYFTRFDALYETVRIARNDAMHTGVYARHATSAAIELCIGLEEALMRAQQIQRLSVADFMVKSAVVVESWQPVAHARQLMLTHSFSFLPVQLGGWKLLSEISLAKFLSGVRSKKKLLATTIEAASNDGLALIDARVVAPEALTSELLAGVDIDHGPALWLVLDEQARLTGVLSPFELM
ncbi:hypothetical protein LP416_07855 [Polaromonas sp. P2-4]|nr:hypothetical protein LP416_07855 [Polaromonas sp. P2-4]